MKWISRGKGSSRKVIPLAQRVGNNIENRWVNSTPMPLATKSSRLCVNCQKNIAVRTTEDGFKVCEPCFDNDTSVSGGSTVPEPFTSVLEESPDLIGEPAMDRGEDKMTEMITNDNSLLDGTATRGSKRLSGSGAILGELFQATKPTNTPPKSKKETEGEE